jgi:hypothetical protein
MYVLVRAKSLTTAQNAQNLSVETAEMTCDFPADPLRFPNPSGDQFTFQPSNF